MVPFTRLPFLAALLFAGLILSGCEALVQPYPDRKMYAMQVDPPQETVPKAGRGVVKIARVRVVAPYDDRTFFYKVGPSELKADYYNVFVATPDYLITSQLLTYLRDAGGFDLYLPPFSGADSDIRLEGIINQLYIDFTDGPNPVAVVEGRFFLVQLKSEGDIVFAQKTYNHRAEAVSGEPEALVNAWNTAFTSLFAELTRDIIDSVEPGTYNRGPIIEEGAVTPE